MELSVIIVNYNVKYFLEQCLLSVYRAGKGIEMEILVIDNYSGDGSREWLEPKFPTVRFIWNEQNLGFSKANNLALEMCKGKKVLFLNPDTILSENSLSDCILFLDDHSQAGALGVKMIDGRGRFLWESKRSFPDPSASFYKMTGLTALFPRSRKFARYHLGHLDENKTHEVEILSGAFMMVRKEVLERTGGFDERFFMYGEDIDLSYRIRNTGWKIYYLGAITILHFKGESTIKNQISYQRRFYGAMREFSKKHFQKKGSGGFNILIFSAIPLRAVFSILGQIILGTKNFLREGISKKRMKSLVIGTQGEYQDLVDQFNRSGISAAVSGFLHPEKFLVPERKQLSEELKLVFHEKGISQVIFCVGSFGYSFMMGALPLIPSSTGIRIHAMESRSVVGSDNREGQGEAYGLQ